MRSVRGNAPNKNNSDRGSMDAALFTWPVNNNDTSAACRICVRCLSDLVDAHYDDEVITAIWQ